MLLQNREDIKKYEFKIFFKTEEKAFFVIFARKYIKEKAKKAKVIESRNN